MFLGRTFYGISAIVSIAAVGISLFTWWAFRPQDHITLVLCSLAAILGTVGAVGCGLVYLSLRETPNVTFDKH
jgi:cytosine/uracil/thiamine/allantoin permease